MVTPVHLLLTDVFTLTNNSFLNMSSAENGFRHTKLTILLCVRNCHHIRLKKEFLAVSPSANTSLPHK